MQWTDFEVRETIKQMLHDWEAASPKQRAEALRMAAQMAADAEGPEPGLSQAARA